MKEKITIIVHPTALEEWMKFVKLSRRYIKNIPKRIFRISQLVYWINNTKQFNRNKKENRIRFWNSLKRKYDVYKVEDAFKHDRLISSKRS